MQDPFPAGVEVFVGVDVAKGDHYACAANPNPLPTTPSPDPSRLERLDNNTGTPPGPTRTARSSVRDAPLGEGNMIGMSLCAPFAAAAGSADIRSGLGALICGGSARESTAVNLAMSGAHHDVEEDINR